MLAQAHPKPSRRAASRHSLWMRNPDANLGKQSFILELLPPEALVAPTLIARDCHTDWTRIGCGSSLSAKPRIVSSALSKDEFPTPSEFMRGRRPEQFSDSRVEENIELDAGFLEYKLESITSRSEEKQFEHLARRLAERLICPNLIPQTGPDWRWRQQS